MNPYTCPKCNKTVNNVGDRLASGRTAYGGCVVGRAIVVQNSTELANVTEGDVLITTQTSPEAVPAIIRAGAIITDRGGILCHAAIVSREFRKACIVGTKNATSTIQTGRMILVAACTGEVYEIGNSERKATACGGEIHDL